MWKKLVLLAVLAVLTVAGFVGYGAYYYYRADYHNAPYVGEDGFLLSFEGGFKAAMRGIPDELINRRYLGQYNPDTPTVYEDSWSICRKPTEQEAELFANYEGRMPGQRLDGICEIDADGDVFVRGWVYSIPDV